MFTIITVDFCMITAFIIMPFIISYHDVIIIIMIKEYTFNLMLCAELISKYIVFHNLFAFSSI